MKKLLLSLGAVAAVAAPVAAVVACGSTDTTQIKATAQFDKTINTMTVNVDLGTDKSIEKNAGGKILEEIRKSILALNAKKGDFELISTRINHLVAIFKYKGETVTTKENVGLVPTPAQKADIASGKLASVPVTPASLRAALNASIDSTLVKLANNPKFKFASVEQGIKDALVSANVILARKQEIKTVNQLNEVLSLIPAKGISVAKETDGFRISFGFTAENDAAMAAHTDLAKTIAYLKTVNAFTVGNYVAQANDSAAQDSAELNKIVTEINGKIQDILDFKGTPKTTGTATTLPAQDLQSKSKTDADIKAVVASTITDLDSAKSAFDVDLTGQGTGNTVSYDASTQILSITAIHAGQTVITQFHITAA